MQLARALFVSAGEVIGIVLGYYALALALGVPWLWLVGVDWRTDSLRFINGVIHLAPLAGVLTLFVLVYAFSDWSARVRTGPAWVRRSIGVLALIWFPSPIFARYYGGWAGEHRFLFLAIVPAAALFLTLAAYALSRAGPAAFRSADRLPPGSSSTHLS